jgi:Urocanase Rossmann-like domain
MPSSNDNPEARAADLEIESEMKAVYCLYAGLAREMDAETGLGGKLLYAGEPDAAGCRLLRAGNIAGAASLTSSAEAAALRGAMHQGAIDFVVTSLDEALRILKNQIRKKQPVAVGVSLRTEVVMREMVERGVQPDLVTPDARAVAEFAAGGARIVELLALDESKRLQFIDLPKDWKQPASVFDALLLEGLADDDHLNRRWVRLAPRYLPAASRRVRLVVCDGARGAGPGSRLLGG